MHFFLKETIEKKPCSITGIAETYRLNGNTLYKQYKHQLSDFENCRKQLKKEFDAGQFVFPQNFGPRMGIDETGLFHGELYTILINKDKKGKKGCLAGIIKGTAGSKVVKAIGEKVHIEKLMNIQEITLDLANSMNWIVRQVAPNAVRTYDRFHVEKLLFEALQSIRVKYRWKAIEEDNDASLKHREEILPNGETRKQLLARSRYFLFKYSALWTSSQAKRAGILFREYPEIQRAYELVMDFKNIFRMNYNEARFYLENWSKKVNTSQIKELTIVKNTIVRHATGILNFLLNKETNASVENFNAKIKDLLRVTRGTNDHDLFFFRLCKLYA